MECFNKNLTATGNPITFPLDNITREQFNCLGIKPDMSRYTLTEWKAFWSNPQICINTFNDYIYSGTGRTFNTDRFAQANVQFLYIFSWFYNKSPDGRLFSPVNSPNFDDFQSTIHTACMNISGVCGTALSRYCGGCSRGQISDNNQLLGYCGCQSPLPSLYQTSQNCDSLCVQINVIKLADPLTGKLSICQSDVCVIDNISITASKSAVGSIAFNQVCPICTQGNRCNCIIDTSVPQVLASLGISSKQAFYQACPSSNCLVIDSQRGTTKSVDCGGIVSEATPPPGNDVVNNNTNSENQVITSDAFAEINPMWYVMIIVILLIFVFAMISYYNIFKKNLNLKKSSLN